MEHHGVEMNPVNSIGVDEEHLQPDTITVEEEEPIISVVVIGSACQPPGFINLEAFPTDEFYKPEDPPGTYAPRFRAENLWGMHLRAGTWLANTEGADYGLLGASVRGDSGGAEGAEAGVEEIPHEGTSVGASAGGDELRHFRDSQVDEDLYLGRVAALRLVGRYVSGRHPLLVQHDQSYSCRLGSRGAVLPAIRSRRNRGSPGTIGTSAVRVSRR